MQMIELDPALSSADKPARYAALLQQAQALFEDEHDSVANAANLAALLWHALPDLNWAGIYRFDGRELVLGPFQGKPACVRIVMGKGVCGTAAVKRETIVVPDVHQFAGHIACDSASNSEIVVPLVQGDTLYGVLDLDSPKFNRFDDEDRKGLEALGRCWVQAIS